MEYPPPQARARLHRTRIDFQPANSGSKDATAPDSTGKVPPVPSGIFLTWSGISLESHWKEDPCLGADVDLRIFFSWWFLNLGKLSTLPRQATKFKLMLLHIHLAPAKPHALSFQPQPLLYGRIAAQFNLSARAQNPLPGQSVSPMQHPRRQSRPSGKARRSRHGTIGGNFAARDAPDGGLDSHPRPRRLIRRLRLSASLLHNLIHPNRTSHSDPLKTSSHKIIPCSRGRCPTCLMVATEIPLPIKNSVAVNPILATFTATA